MEVKKGSRRIRGKEEREKRGHEEEMGRNEKGKGKGTGLKGRRRWARLKKNKRDERKGRRMA